MPNYKTHSIHTEMVIKKIDKKADLDAEDLKKFAFGPDALMTMDYRLFDYQHSHNTGHFLNALIQYVKENKLQDNKKVMAYLYGQLDHFVLDFVMHPLIYYMTARLPLKYKINPHALIEMWIDDYVMMKHNKKKYSYTFNTPLLNKELTNMINTTYTRVFNSSNVAIKYDLGTFTLVQFDGIRKSKSAILKDFCKKIKLGDIFYGRSIAKISRFLNLEHRSIMHPITGEKTQDSFDDLWNKSLDISCELIDDVNKYLYSGRNLDNYFIRNNISYNTGLPCREKEEFKYVKRYR